MKSHFSRISDWSVFVLVLRILKGSVFDVVGVVGVAGVIGVVFDVVAEDAAKSHSLRILYW